MVNTSACMMGQGLIAAESYLSKTRRDCLEKQGVVGRGASEAHAPHTEVKLGQKVLNAMTELGRPVFERIS